MSKCDIRCTCTHTRSRSLMYSEQLGSWVCLQCITDEDRKILHTEKVKNKLLGRRDHKGIDFGIGVTPRLTEMGIRWAELRTDDSTDGGK